MSPLLYWPVVIFVTSLAAFWVGNRVNRPKRVPVERLADPAPLPGEPDLVGQVYQLPRAGRFDVTWQDSTFTGAGVPFDLMTVLSDGYTRGLAAASQADVADQMAVLIAEMRAEQWRGEG